MVLVSGGFSNGTPIFSIADISKEPWKRVWGGIHTKEGWLYPAYYPFGKFVFKEIKAVSPKAEYDDLGKQHIVNLANANASMIEAENEYKQGMKIKLPVDDSFFPKDFMPFEHQKLGILRVVNYWRAFFLWEMGAGKTRTVIDGLRLLRHFKQFKKAMVIVPPVVIPTWQREIARCSNNHLSSMLYTGKDVDILNAEEHDFIIMSYARARLEIMANPKVFENLDYDTVIADESHFMGNWDSDQTRAALLIGSKATRRYLLSGTAADNPQKLYPQLRFLSSSLMPYDYAHYKKQHLFFAENSRFFVTGYKNLNVLNEKVDMVATRIKKSECLDLPPVTIIDIDFHLGPKQKAKYNELVENMSASTDNNGDLVIQHGAMRVLKLQQLLSGFMKFSMDEQICNDCTFMEYCIMNHYKPYSKDCAIEQKPLKSTTIREVENPKLEVFKDLIETILNSDETNKILCWAHFEEELNDMEDLCKKLKIGYVRLDGSTTKDIGSIEDKFQKDEKCRVLIGQIKSGIGITLTAANYTIYYSLTWDVLQYRQSLDRNNRPGQKRNMTVYRLLAAAEYETLDRHMAYILTFKEQISQTLVEKVVCLKCKNRSFCENQKILPFRKGCVYQAEVSKPVTKLTVIQ